MKRAFVTKKLKVLMAIIVMSLCVACAFCLFGCDFLYQCDHDYSSWMVETAATCTRDGKEARRCILCGDVEYQTIPASHMYGEGVITEYNKCGENGVITYNCIRCDYSYTNIKVINHKYGDAVITKEASCNNAGEKESTCKLCGDVRRVSYTVDHTFAQEWSSDAEGHWHAATCGCDEIVGYAKHEFVKDVCKICGSLDANLLIVNSERLVNISKDPNRAYQLKADIDMSGKSWTPFDFSGSIEGNGFTIKNLSVETSKGNLGVFLSLKGTIKNVNFENLSIVSTSYDDVFVGGVCSLLEGTIDNVTITGKVDGDAGFVGGVAGRIISGKISNCKNYANVSAKSTLDGGCCGGIVGQFNGGEISNCENHGDVTDKYNAGGIVGKFYLDKDKKCSYDGLANYGKISGEKNTGGIVGYFQLNSSLTSNGGLKNYGIINGKENVGGIFGKVYEKLEVGHYNVTFKNYTNNGNVNGEVAVGGISGYIFLDADNDLWAADVCLTMERCVNEADISGNKYVGGIVGTATTDIKTSVIRNCSSMGKIKAACYVGGIAGKLNNISLEDCENTRSTFEGLSYVVESATKYVYVGGFVGYGYNTIIKGCRNDIPIRYYDEGTCVGGIVGYLYYDTAIEISGCLNDEEVYARDSQNVGGIVGYLRAAVTIFGDKSIRLNRLENVENVTGGKNVGGLFGNIYAYSLTAVELLNSGDISGDANVGEFGGVIVCSSGSTLSEHGNNGSVTCNGKVIDNCIFGDGTTNLKIFE